MTIHSPARLEALAAMDAPITEHREPARQGGRRYLRCLGCDREVVGTDESRLPHAPGCPNR